MKKPLSVCPLSLSKVFVCLVVILTSSILLITYAVLLPLVLNTYSPAWIAWHLCYGHWNLIMIAFHYYKAAKTSPGCPPTVRQLQFSVVRQRNPVSYCLHLCYLNSEERLTFSFDTHVNWLSLSHHLPKLHVEASEKCWVSDPKVFIPVRSLFFSCCKLSVAK